MKHFLVIQNVNDLSCNAQSLTLQFLSFDDLRHKTETHCYTLMRNEVKNGILSKHVTKNHMHNAISITIML
jgi:hypothetical protein